MGALSRLFVSASLLLFVGCAHRVDIGPTDLDRLSKNVSIPNKTKIDKAVGYYIPAAEKEKVFSASIGDGEKINFQAYKNIEPGLHRALSNLYTKVVPLASANDRAVISQHNLAYVFIPTITTESALKPASMTKDGSEAKFTLFLDFKALDAAGQTVAQKRVQGRGSYVYYPPEDKKEVFGKVAQEASANALRALQDEIYRVAELHK